MGATVDRKGASDYARSFLTAFIKSLGFKRILVRSDSERSLLSLIESVTSNLTGVELVMMTSPEGDHQANGLAEVGVREIKAQTRILRSQLEQRLGSRIDEKDPLMSWIPHHAANCVCRYRIMDDGRTPDQRRCGKTWKRPVVEFGESVHFRPVGENNALREIWCCNFPHARWCEERNENCENDGTREMGSRVQCNVCWSSLAIETRSTESGETVVLEAEAEQGVAPVIVMPAVPRVDRRRFVTKRDLVKYVYTDECQACAQLAPGMHNAKVPHDDRCRDGIGEVMASDDDQRQVERMMSRSCSEAGEEVDVGESSVQPRSVHEEDQPRPEIRSVPRPVEEQPVPTVRVGGSSGSGTRSGVGSRASETNTDDREVKRVRFTESRGQKRQGEDVEELAAKAEVQHLDADVEVPAHKTSLQRTNK